jgi:hypothetical protein
MRLNGMRLNGMRLNGMRLNGMRLNGMRLNGSTLGGTLDDGTWIDGQGLVGALLVGELEDGSEATLRIDALRQSTEPGDEDIFYYTVSVSDPATETWQPACGSVDGVATEAIAVPGVWDMSEGTATGGSHSDSADHFTFGCTDAAIGKCVEWGYKPWIEVTRCDQGDKHHHHTECWTVPGEDYHQTCTRLARADYCGDGRSSTADGTPIDVYDNVGIESPDTAHDWTQEAEWNPDGASCINRNSDLRHDPAPACAKALLDNHCGDDWDNASTLIMTDLLTVPHDDDEQ